MQEYTKRVHSQYAKTHRDLFIEIWDKYDVNKDGVMSQKECYALVRDALEASKRLMPQQLEDVIVNMLLIPLPKPVGTFPSYHFAVSLCVLTSLPRSFCCPLTVCAALQTMLRPRLFDPRCINCPLPP